MNRRFAAAAFAWLVAGIALAGIGRWTPSSGLDSRVVVGSDGVLYQGGFELVFRSVDHGITWQQLPTAPAGLFGFPYVEVLVADHSGAIYAATYTGGEGQIVTFVSVTRDAGATWTLLLPEMFSTNDVDLWLDPFSAGTLFLRSGFLGRPGSVPAYGRLSRSTDGGTQWSEIDQALIGLGYPGSVTTFALDPQTSGRVYAATAIVDFASGAVSAPGLYASSDGGTTWTHTAGNPPGALTTLVVDPFQPSKIYGGGPSGIVMSPDAGKTFTSVSALPTTQVVVDPLHSGRLYAGTSGGVLGSTDGGTTWSTLNSGLTDLAVHALTLDASGGFLYAATASGTFVYQVLDPGALVLNAANPFAITLTATDQRTGRVGPGVATPMNDLWGYFSIPAITGNPGNPEVFVKMLDGTALNGSYWFFYGGLTDLEYTLTVTEGVTGKQRTYTKPAGSECGGSDTAAFGP